MHVVGIDLTTTPQGAMLVVRGALELLVKVEHEDFSWQDVVSEAAELRSIFDEHVEQTLVTQ